MYARIDANQRVVETFEWDGSPLIANEGEFFVESSQYQAGAFYGCTGLPAFTSLGVEPDVSEDTPAPKKGKKYA